MTLHLLNNCLIQIVVISLLTAPCLGCTAVHTPCRLFNTIPRSGFNDFNAECTGVEGVFPPKEKCIIPAGETFSLEDDACDVRGSIEGRPILLDDTEFNATADIQFSCSRTGVLSASSLGHPPTVLDNDIKNADCHSSLSAHSCPFTIASGPWQLSANQFTGDNISCSDGVCTPVDGQQFTIPLEACELNGQNRPLLLNAIEVPVATEITQDTVFECRNTVLTSTGGSASAVDVDAIACGTSCPYAITSTVGVLNPADIGCASAPGECLLAVPGKNGVQEAPLCGGGGNTIRVVDHSGNTLAPVITSAVPDDLFDFQCDDGHLSIVHRPDSGTGTATTFMNVKTFSCA